MTDDPNLDAVAEPAWSGAGRWRRLRSRIADTGRALNPGPVTRRGAGLGVAATMVVMAIAAGAAFRPGLGLLDIPVGSLTGAIIAILVGASALLALRLLGVLRSLLTPLGFAGLAGIAAVFAIALDLPPAIAIVSGLGVALIEALLGGALALAAGGGFRARTLPIRCLAVTALVAGLAGNAAVAWFLTARGWNDHLVKAWPDSAVVEPLVAPDPSLRGAFEVRTLTYGSGSDHRRTEFAAGVAIKTESVDATPLLKGNEGFKMKARAWYWGFDAKHFPRDGRVWYPLGEGPFPLVLIVHGNHSMEEHSDPGYAYLCEHLASRGFIAVSVDENFFNGSWAGGLDKENGARAWMLLEHLRLWRGWASAPKNPFYGKVDMSAIALVGHSRGGEAAALAGALNRLKYFPDDATVALHSGFGIKAVVAIAPSDGQFTPAGQPNPLENLDYLVIQGGHDSDVSFFMGARQYRRVHFTDGNPWFKASVYAYRANHGQFNTVWGASDIDWPASLFLNHKPLLSGNDQRRLGKTLITAFLEAGLKGRTVYVEAFRDLRRARPWLPEDLYVTRYADASYTTVADFEEDADVTTATLAGGTIAGHGLAVWREQRLPPRKGEARQIGVAVLGWRQPAGGKGGAPASYEITLPAGAAAAVGLSRRSSLVFALAESDEELPKPETAGKQPKGADQPPAAIPTKDQPRQPLDFSVELADGAGAVARLPISRFRAVPLPLVARFTKLRDESGFYGKATEPVLQDFELPLASFAAAAPHFSPSILKVIRLVFDRSPKGVVILEDVALVPDPQARTP